MSYCRWSTDIKRTLPFMDFLDLVQENGYSEAMQTLEDMGAEWSDWYIFDHADDCLALYHTRGDPVCMDYDDVQEMYKDDNWEPLEKAMGHPITQKDWLTEIVKIALDDYYETK